MRYQLDSSLFKWMLHPGWKSGPPDPKQIGHRLRWGYWIFVAFGTVGFVYLVIQIATGKANGN